MRITCVGFRDGAIFHSGWRLAKLSLMGH